LDEKTRELIKIRLEKAEEDIETAAELLSLKRYRAAVNCYRQIGKIDRIMADTGAVFSLFPPENATGNYVKVVQRIPVKIVPDQNTDPEHVLRIGMSVEPTTVIGKKESGDGEK
jgi:hypothetical protein